MPTIRFRVESLSGERLDRAIAARAERSGIDISNRKAKQLVEDGRVRVDGREAWKASRNLKKGQDVEARIPEEWVEPAEPDLVDLGGRILYVDDDVLAVNKPAGVPTHATHDPDRDHVRAAVHRWLAERGDPSPYVAVHHRLDVDTSGVLLFGIARRANKGLADAFSQRQADKRYVAIVTGEPPGEMFDVEDHLRWNSSSARMEAVHSGGDFASTSFEVLAGAHGVHVVRANIHTGRRHQIRVHLADLGMPIVGDTLYGGRDEFDGMQVARAMLHAERLVLPHPVRDDSLDIFAPWPDDFLTTLSQTGLEIAGQEA